MVIPTQFGWLAVVALLAAGPALAETPSPAPTPTTPLNSVPEKIAPGAKPTEPVQNFSEKLSQSNGVIQPKEVDPAIEKPAPKALDQNVVRPPGTPGGARRRRPNRDHNLREAPP